MFNLNGKEFVESSIAKAVLSAGGQIADLSTSDMVEVDCTAWEGFDYAEQGHWYYDSCQAKCKGATPSTHVVIGYHFDDGAEFCSYEGKLEYFYNSTFIVIPRESYEAWAGQFKYEDEAVRQGFSDWG